ncbi:MAG: AAA family ATPase [Bryobacteraceae bacterium]|nr:AAA family ATPase [Bryobacteraceae bacterium]
MLRQVYIDNYRCFVNFTIDLEREQLILGGNGTGKSSFVDCLSDLKSLLDGKDIQVLFPATTRTRWQNLNQQIFELHATLAGSDYTFRLELDSWGARPPKTRIKRELVMCDGQILFEFSVGEVHLYNDRAEHKVTYEFDWFRSALATIQQRHDNTRLWAFRVWLDNLHCLRLNPANFSDEADTEDPFPSIDFSNFTAWYRYVAQERGDAQGRLQQLIRAAIPGLESLDLRSKGTQRKLSARFRSSEASSSFEISFEDLSDGQRVLICLYAVLAFLVARDSIILLDEPDNFLAISEIQPWVSALREESSDTDCQVLFISHNSEIINYMATDAGVVFRREGIGPVRVARWRSGVDSLSPAEAMARGWVLDE